MTARPVIPRELADRDVYDTVSYYLGADAPDAALGFIDTLEAAYLHIARHSASGWPHHAHAVDLPGLRVWPIKDYPYLVFHLERPDHIDVWRVLHEERDIPVWLRQPDGT